MNKIKVDKCKLQAYFEGDAHSLEEVSIAGVSNLQKLEEWLRANTEAKAFCEKELKDIQDQIRGFLARQRLVKAMFRRAHKQTRKLERKVKNLQRVTKPNFELNTWYKGEQSWTKGRYLYPTKVTAAGRVCGYVVEKKARSLYSTHRANNPGTFSYTHSPPPSIDMWYIRAATSLDGAQLENASKLELLVTVGNLDRLLRTYKKAGEKISFFVEDGSGFVSLSSKYPHESE